ncbi:hypothetical protein AB0F18_07465 [Streptomyces sp. NPDC029216]|uniref:hypothetical protein n=1 Tax=Streptomyces sp. NPDC029216 TaxID=3154701 RepID=UPI0033F639D5
MSRGKRYCLALGTAAVLLSGAGVAAAAPAGVEPRPAAGSVGTPSDWYYAGTYRTLDNCVTAGRSSGQQWRCERVTASTKYALWLNG